MTNSIRHLLVMCAPYGPMDHMCIAGLQGFAAAGAIVMLGNASADVTLTRCEMATQALKVIEENPGHVFWVLWADSDIVISGNVQRLINYAKAAYAKLGFEVSVSGTYVRRAAPSHVAAVAVRKDSPFASRGTALDGSAELVPCLTGLGCLLQPVKAFVRHVKGSPEFETGLGKLRAVCQARTAHGSEVGRYVQMDDLSRLHWVGEDFDYCIREYELGSAVLLAPEIFTHRVTVDLKPRGSVLLEGHGIAKMPE